jgi:hypothetical protein
MDQKIFLSASDARSWLLGRNNLIIYEDAIFIFWYVD